MLVIDCLIFDISVHLHLSWNEFFIFVVECRLIRRNIKPIPKIWRRLVRWLMLWHSWSRAVVEISNWQKSGEGHTFGACFSANEVLVKFVLVRAVLDGIDSKSMLAIELFFSCWINRTIYWYFPKPVIWW